ncbi:MAG: glycosyltransferase family 87 protein [Isosphaeraceae bacterium]
MALLRVLRGALWVKSLIAAILAILVIHLYAVSRHELFGLNFQFFWKTGREVWGGVDPYCPSRFAEHPFLNPPTALPLFALFAALPIRASLAFWTLLNVSSSLGLIALARSALMSQDRLGIAGHQARGGLESLPPVAIAGLAICLSFSEASLKGLCLGQVGVFTAVMLVLALVAQGRGQPIWAGVCLFLATVRFVTTIPFLVLFLRRPDRLSWVVLLALALGSCALTGRIADLPGRLATLAQRAGELSAPGKVNDYSYEGTRNESIISFDHLFYRLEMRDRDWIRYAQVFALLTVGAWAAYLVIMNDRPRPATACLVSFFSLLFLYHRDYDSVILALPLVHCAGRLGEATGRARWAYAAIGVSTIGVLYMSSTFVRSLTSLTLQWGAWGRLVQAAVLPYATWLILLCMLILFRVEARARARFAS